MTLVGAVNKKRGNFLFHKAMQSIYLKKIYYQCDVTSYIAGFQNGAEICCTLSCQKYGIFNGLADSFPTFFSISIETNIKNVCITFLMFDIFKSLKYRIKTLY